MPHVGPKVINPWPARPQPAPVPDGTPCCARGVTAPMCYNVYTMSETVGVRALRQRASELLQRVAGGEVVTVTDRGLPVARLVPLHGGTLEQLVREGRATPADGHLLARVGELGLPEATSTGTPPSVALAELRADER